MGSGGVTERGGWDGGILDEDAVVGVEKVE